MPSMLYEIVLLVEGPEANHCARWLAEAECPFCGIWRKCGQ